MHGVQKNAFKQEAQEAGKKAIYRDNLNLKKVIQVEKFGWRMAVQKNGKKSGPMLVNLKTPDQANHLIQNELVIKNKLKMVELFNSYCLISCCYSCQGYAHQA